MTTVAASAGRIALERSATQARALARWGWRHPLGAVGAFILLATVVAAVFSPLLAPFGPNDIVGKSFESVSLDHWMGTDRPGRDVFSRVIYGSRIALYVGVSATFLSVAIGGLWGIASAYFGGLFDLLSQRLVDILMSFPPIVFALALVTALGPSVNNVIIALFITLLPGSVRVLRSQALGISANMYIDAARAVGASHPRILLRHIAPNSMAPALVLFSTRVGQAVVAEATLSFLGVGASPTTPSWGGMITIGTTSLFLQGVNIIIFPGIALALLVFATNFMGDALRDTLDPRLRGR